MSSGKERPSAGKRLGRLIVGEPELTQVAVTKADHERISRFVDYVTADGFGLAAMVTRMERLKFETIVTGKSYKEVLADPEGSSGIDDLPTAHLDE